MLTASQAAMFVAILFFGMVMGFCASSTHSRGRVWRVRCVTIATIVNYVFAIGMLYVGRNVWYFNVAAVAYSFMVCAGIMGDLDHNPSKISEITASRTTTRRMLLASRLPHRIADRDSSTLARREMLARGCDYDDDGGSTVAPATIIAAATETESSYVKVRTATFTNGTGAMLRVAMYGIIIVVAPYAALRCGLTVRSVVILTTGIAAACLLLDLRYKIDPVDQLFS